MTKTAREAAAWSAVACYRFGSIALQMTFANRPYKRHTFPSNHVPSSSLQKVKAVASYRTPNSH